MPTVAFASVVDADGLRALLAPRDDVVAEEAPDQVEAGRWHFAMREGPFRSYRRELVVGGADATGHVRVEQRTTYRLALTYFRVVFALPVRHTLGRWPTPGHQPWWAPPSRIDTRTARVLDVLAAASLVVGYLNTLVTQTITFAADEFGTSRRPASGTT